MCPHEVGLGSANMTVQALPNYSIEHQFRCQNTISGREFDYFSKKMKNFWLYLFDIYTIIDCNKGSIQKLFALQKSVMAPTT